MSAPAPYDARLARLRDAMAAAGADVYICDHAEMMVWLTGYTVSETFYRAAIVPAEGDPVIVLRRIDEVPCRAATWVPNVVAYADHEDAHARVAAEIRRFAPGTVGADYTSFGFTAHTRDGLAELLPGTTFVDIPQSSGHLRAVKDATEVATIEAAGRIGSGAMAAIARALKPGMRPRDASAIAAFHYLTEGADDYWVGPISISRRAEADGHGMGFLHATLHDDALSEGDILHVELVPRVSYYSCRFMRSIKLGEPTAGERTVMDRLVALQDEQFAAMRPGAKAADVDAIMRRGLIAAGLRDDYPNITGYQVGLYAKTPRSSDTSLSLHPGADWAFEAGQTFHVYATAQGLALSETVVVEDGGARLLTHTPRRILVAGESV
ncbi:M24 family metallopeptidase [Acuticoccus sediminis]|uniref:M24 family metallopeptidase n=1 Tax=Acuticoccus sediminis TaxID=2184697 RepID=UPI001CFF2476|nr:Xaa-Pro peptidase family protein [Acuticoccus sediminis]